MQNDTEYAHRAQQILTERERRTSFFPSEIFDEFAWTMLLHLFVAMHDNNALSEDELFERVHATPPVGRRWLRHLVEDEQVGARNDGDDIVLTAASISRMRAFLGEMGRVDIVAD